MKRFLIILVALLWCNVGVALTQQAAIDQYLSGRKLDLIEGIWADKWGNIKMYTKSGNGYQEIRIKSRKRASGSYGGSLQKGSENYYYGDGFSYYGNQEVPCDVTVTINGNNGTWVCTDNRSGPLRSTLHRLWPTDLSSHNAKFGGSDSEKIEMASMIDKAKDTCKSLGFKDGTEKFADCALKLYSQRVELAAQNNQTVVMQPQSSGSNTMTIYDPVRDSNALIQKGQRMLSGACTLGINC